MRIPALSLAHYRGFMERSVGPVTKIVQDYADRPEALKEFRAEFETLAGSYFHDNVVHQDYVLTRAAAR